MIFQNVATYSYICTYVLNVQPCIVWEGKMFIEYTFTLKTPLHLLACLCFQIHFFTFVSLILCYEKQNTLGKRLERRKKIVEFLKRLPPRSMPRFPHQPPRCLSDRPGMDRAIAATVLVVFNISSTIN